jgi:hypothetical protein
VAPPRVSEADVRVSSEMSGLLAWPGMEDCVLGVKRRSEGAVPWGTGLAENSGAASLPTFTPGACFGMLVCKAYEDGERAYAFGCHGLGAGDSGMEFSLVADGFGVSVGRHVGF